MGYRAEDACSRSTTLPGAACWLDGRRRNSSHLSSRIGVGLGGPVPRTVPSGIRRTTAELVRGRRVAVIIDDFVARGGCEVDFLDHRTRVAMRATWLAAQARVPVVPVTIYYRSGVICVHFRPALSPGQTRGARAQTTRVLIDALAGRIERRPAEWQDLFAFFDARVPRATSVRRYADLGAP